MAKCLRCNGTGEIPCPLCKIEGISKKCLLCDGKNTFVCPRCNGRGTMSLLWWIPGKAIRVCANRFKMPNVKPL